MNWLRAGRRKGPGQGAPDADVPVTPLDAHDLDWFHGRVADIDALVQLPASMMLVSGHPGVGKTDLLQAASLTTRTSFPGAAVAAPVMLEHRSGTLQCSLLEGLGMALAEFESAESSGERWARVFADAAQRTADAGVRDMIRGAHGFMVGMVRARLGDEAADALASVEKNLNEALQEQLSNQIAREADRGAMAAFCLLAARTQELVGAPVVLSLDRGERLGDSDFQMLLDLASQLPTSVHVVVSHTLRGTDDDDRVRRLTEAASTSGHPLKALKLDGLLRPEVEAWMRQRGLEPEAGTATNIDEVMRVTSGYPLHVDLALTAIEDGRSLSELDADGGLVSMMQRNYADLDFDDQQAVMHLCAFSDPPDDSTVTALLGIDASAWAVRQKRLIDSRFLVTRVREVPWFHELGRRVVWEQVLTSNQREESARGGVAALAEVMSAPGPVSIQHCIDLAQLASLVPGDASTYPKLDRVLALGRGHLAVLGSLFELVDEEQNVQAGAIADVVGHARFRFGVHDLDLYEAARELVDLELVVIAENEENAVLVAAMGSHEAHHASVGRIVNELERVPLPSISRWVIEVLLQHCSGFHSANLGAGRISLAQLSKVMKDGQIDRDGDHVQWATRPGIIFRPRLGDLDFAGGVLFNSAEDRDLAFETLFELRSGTFAFGEPLDLSQLLKWPVDQPVQSRRFTSAAQHITGVSFETMSPARVPDLPSDLTVAEEMELTVKTWATLRELANDIERMVLNLDRPRGIGYFTAGEGVLWVEVSGRSDVQCLGELEGRAFALASRTAFDRGLGLTAGQRMMTMHYRTGKPKNPVPALLTETHKDMRAFNQQQGMNQGSRRLLADSEQLRDAVLISLDRRRTDADRLVRDGLLPPSELPLGMEVFALVVPPRGTGRIRDGDGDELISIVQRTDGPNRVELAVVDRDEVPTDRAWNDLSPFETRFDIAHIQPRVPGVTFSASWLSYGLEGLLGHDRVWIEYPSTDPTGLED